MLNIHDFRHYSNCQQLLAIGSTSELRLVYHNIDGSNRFFVNQLNIEASRRSRSKVRTTFIKGVNNKISVLITISRCRCYPTSVKNLMTNNGEYPYLALPTVFKINLNNWHDGLKVMLTQVEYDRGIPSAA